MNLIINILITIGIALGVCITLVVVTLVALFILSRPLLAPYVGLPHDQEKQKEFDKQFRGTYLFVSRIYFLLILLVAFAAIHLPTPYPLGTAVAIVITGILLGIFLWL